MRNENGIVKGDVIVEDVYELLGTINGSVLVKSNGLFKCFGMVNKDVKVQEGGQALIKGMVNGNVINENGEIMISGTVNGTLIDHSNKIKVAPTAVISFCSELTDFSRRLTCGKQASCQSRRTKQPFSSHMPRQSSVSLPLPLKKYLL
jgi:hypothetical protein